MYTKGPSGPHVVPDGGRRQTSLTVPSAAAPTWVPAEVPSGALKSRLKRETPAWEHSTPPSSRSPPSPPRHSVVGLPISLRRTEPAETGGRNSSCTTL